MNPLPRPSPAAPAAPARGLALTFRVLADDQGELAVQAVFAALDDADPAVRDRAVEVLLGWDRASDLLPLLRRFGVLSEAARARLVERAPRLLGPLREALHDRDRNVRLAAVELLSAHDAPEILPLLAIALIEVPPQRATLAARMRAVVQAHVARREALRARFGGDTPAADLALRASEEYQPLRREEDELLVALDAALRSAHLHQAPDVLLAALALGEGGELLALRALARDDAAGRFVETQLQEQDDAGVGRTLARGCFLSDREPVPERLARLLARNTRAATWRGFGAALETREPAAVLGRVQKLGRIPWWPLLAANVAATPAPIVQLHLRLAAEQDDDRALQIERYETLLGAGDAEAVRTAIARLQALRATGWEPRLAGAARVPDEALQRLALGHLQRLPEGPERRALLAPFLTSSCAAVRDAAAQAVTERRKEAYLAAFETLDPEARAAAGRAIARLDARFVHEVARDLESDDEQRRLRALRIITTIEQEDRVQQEVIRLMRDPSKLVRAHVVNLLAAFGTPEALKVLLAALADDDRRVKANAIEALEGLGSPKVKDVLRPFLRHADNRVRANAAKALYHLGEPAAAEVLVAMCAESDDLMRLSGVWGLGETAGLAQRALLERLRDGDPSAPVREKARLVLERLEAAAEHPR